MAQYDSTIERASSDTSSSDLHSEEIDAYREARLGEIEPFRKYAVIATEGALNHENQEVTLPEEDAERILLGSDSLPQKVGEHITALLSAGQIREHRAIRNLDEYTLELEPSY